MEWKKPNQELSLSAKEVHVWRTSLNVSDSEIIHLKNFLSSQELERVHRLKNPMHGRNALAGYGILREILGRYLAMDPKKIRFDFGSHGKPYIAMDMNHLRIQFNMTHTRQLVLYALTLENEIGIDAEYVDDKVRAEDLAMRFFSSLEYQQLMKLSQQSRLAGFYRCWTRKEAFIKAHGKGLSYPLNKFSVSLDPHCVDCLIDLDDPELSIRDWKLTSLIENEEYMAALAVENGFSQINRFQWQESNSR